MKKKPNKLIKVEEFISNYFRWSQERGMMYGSVSELESNWNLLDHIFFILNDLEDQMHDLNFPAFLRSKGYGAKSASMIIKENHSTNSYTELNNLWNEYIEWRTERI